MNTRDFNTTVLFYPNKNPKLRLFALWYFTTLMVVWNILGHTVLGFEQSHAATVVGVGAAIFIQLFLEWVDARAKGREVRFAGSVGNFLNSLPAALIPGLACSMLLYPNDRLWPIEAADGYRELGNVQIHRLEWVGHTPMIEAPGKTAELIEAFATPPGGGRRPDATVTPRATGTAR